jgi:hypothetical protein
MGSAWIRSLIRTNIENRRRYLARVKFANEKRNLKAANPQTATPKKKRGRPKDPESLKRRMLELYTEFAESMMEKNILDVMDDGKENDSDDSDEEEMWKDPEEFR